MSLYKAAHHIDVLADRTTLFKVIEDYESYPALLDDFLTVRVDQVVNRRVMVSFEQAMLKASIRYTLSLDHKAPSQITWTLMHGDHVDHFSGSWQLDESSPTLTRLSLRVSLELSQWIPEIMLLRMQDSFWVRLLEAFKIQAELAAGPRTTNANPSINPRLDNSF